MSSPERIKECVDQDGVPVRYAYSLPDEETLRRLIDFPNNGIPPYLPAVLLHFGGEREIVFGNARIHYEIVKTVAHEKGKDIKEMSYGKDWSQMQIYFEKGLTKFNKIISVGSLRENDVCLLLRSICPQLFVPSRISIIAMTTSTRYIYDPISGELQRILRAIQGDEIKSLGRIQTSPASV